MHTKRIIPCLDVKAGRVVKGVNFVNLIDAGDPVEIAAAYDKAGADELVFLDITASSDARNIMIDDGTKAGYDNELTRIIAENVDIPVIASGGAGKKEHFYDTLTEGKADAALAASLFHFNELKISDLKEYLDQRGISVRR